MPLFLNRVLIAGNLTRDPDVRQAGEHAVCSFGLAINRRYRNKDGEQQEEATFIDVECWGRTAELVGQYLSKGRNAHIEGRLKLDQWEDKDSGGRRSKLKVVADRVGFIGSASDDQQPAPAAPSPADLGDDEPPI